MEASQEGALHGPMRCAALANHPCALLLAEEVCGLMEGRSNPTAA